MLDSDDSFTVLVWAVGPTENEIAHTLLAIFLNSKKFSGKNPHLFCHKPIWSLNSEKCIRNLKASSVLNV